MMRDVPGVRVSWWWAALVVAWAGSVAGQIPQPRLSAIYPAGGQLGESLDVLISGTDLEGVDELRFDHPGLRAFRRKEPNGFRVAIAPGVTLGQHDVRAVSRLGVSNARVFVVEARVQSREIEPNDRPETATPLRLHQVMNGVIQAAADVDCFRLEATPGQRVVVEVQAVGIDSRLDATLRVFADGGRKVAEAHATQGSDPILELTVPRSGSLLIQLHDGTYAGGPDFVYRLLAHDGPREVAIQPTVAQPDVPSRLTRLGRGFGPSGTPAGTTSDGQPLERREDDATLVDPDRDAPVLGSGTFFPRSPMAGLAAWEIPTAGSGLGAAPLIVAAATDPIVVEQEPNDLDHPQEVALPCDISGCFATPGDLDVYRFTARKGQVWWLEVWAERLGRSTDVSMILQRVMDKAPPQDLATADDTADPAGAPRWTGRTVDPAYRWQVPEDGTYRVLLADLYGSQRGDPRFTYRLNIRPERPDFRLFVVSNSPNQPEAMTLRAGGRASSYVQVRRFDGFSRPIRVEPIDLPPGVTCDPVVVGPGQSLAPIVFQASPDARPQVGAIRLIGRGLSSDRKEALDDSAKPAPERVHEAIAGQINGPPNPAIQPPNPAPARVTREFVVAVRDSAPFRLDATPTDPWAAPGDTVSLTVNLQRFGEFTEAVALTTTDLPPKLPGSQANIAQNATTATLSFAIPKDMLPGLYTFVVRGSGPFPFSKDPNAKPKPNVVVTEPSNVVRLTIQK